MIRARHPLLLLLLLAFAVIASISCDAEGERDAGQPDAGDGEGEDPPPLELGEPCSESTVACAAGLVCQVTCAVHDTNCTDGCAPGLICRTFTRDGVPVAEECAPPAPEEEACLVVERSSDEDQNDFGFEIACEEGLVCAAVLESFGGATWRCRRPGAEATSCDPAVSTCAGGLVCHASNPCDAAEHSCRAPGPVGSLCELDLGCIGNSLPCVAPAVCDAETGRCAL